MQPWELVPLPLSAAGPDNDLNEKIDAYVQRAISDEDALIYAFGETWGPEYDKAEKYFGFKPGRWIHDIRFNQGNPPGRFAAQNGPWQDGELISEFPREQQWVGIFLKFHTQGWHSDDGNGSLITPQDRDHPNRPHAPVDRERIPNFEVPDGLVRIIAAYVNDVKTPERETVTLLNTADVPVRLTGPQIKDKQKNSSAIAVGIGRSGLASTLIASKGNPGSTIFCEDVVLPTNHCGAMNDATVKGVIAMPLTSYGQHAPIACRHCSCRRHCHNERHHGIAEN